MNYRGWALFMDCDMLMEADISRIMEIKRRQVCCTSL
jgi:hypothetical protein